MIEFRSWDSYWDFCRSVEGEFRFVHSAETRDFLAAVAKSAVERVIDLPKGTELWRAQKDYVQEIDEETLTPIDFPLPKERMKPIPGKALEGRANPQGIAVLYLADDMKTAMAETRPWKDVVLSIGRFVLARDVRLVDCSEEESGLIFLGDNEPSADEKRRAVWGWINHAFARPVTRAEPSTDYVPTQILAELFRQVGFDGIRHRSSIESGRNVILFNLDDATISECGLYKLKSLEHHFEQAGYWRRYT